MDGVDRASPVDRVDGVDRVDRAGVDSDKASVEGTSKKGRWKAALVREVKSHPFGYGVLAVAVAAGPFLILMIFPEVSALQAVVGGIAFGVYLALCAVPQKFM